MAHARRFTLCAAALVGWTSAALHTRVPTAALRRTVSSGARTHALASATAPAANPLLDQAALPRFGTIDASHVQPAMSELLGEFTRGLRALEADLSVALRSDQPGTLTWASVVERLERLRAPLEYSYGVVSHLTGVKSSDALRDAHQQVQPLVVEAMSSFQQSRPLCDAYRRLIADSDAAVVAGDAPTLDDAQRRIVQSALAEMELAGVALEGEAQARFNAIKLELAELATTFSNHVLDATKAYGLELTSREQVAGFPPSLLAMTAAAAAAAGNAHATAEAGPWRVTLDGPCYVSLMQSASDRSLRERVYRAYATRAGAGSAFDNSATVRRVLELRASMAALLGRESYAHVSLARKMAGEPAAVNALIERVRDAARPAAEAELGELRAFAAERGQAEPLALWDVPYWAERRREALFAFSDEELRAYFPLERVLDGLFALVDKLFSVAVVRADGEAEAWHADVGYYKLIDRATGEERAAFFLDPYARPAEKRPGAWMDVCTGRSEALGRKPVAYLTCNSAPPVGEMPALLAFRDVQTLFHETGHGLQHMLTRVRYADAAGINNVEWDAVELPSQWMENWCYHRETVRSFARHYKTGEPLPDELFDKLAAARTYNAGLATLRQLLFSKLDLELHGDSNAFRPSQPGAGGSPFDVQRALAPRYAVLEPLPDDMFLCSFAHVFAGGYAAGYYSYLWAEVLSADAFAAFEEAGLADDSQLRRLGARFRETVLELGGSRHPSEVFEAFRGRQPDARALLREKGLLPTGP